jgi:putative sigma-54 modulation protein
MQVIIQGKNIEVTDWLREYVEKKIGKLDRYLPAISEARVELSVQKTRNAAHRQVVQVTLHGDRLILRGEERSDDMTASIDAVLDKLQRQITRYKEKHYRGRNREPLPATETLGEEQRRIVRVKRFPAFTMDAEEAIDQMELLGHDFFVFRNAESNEVNVLYRRRDGNYGLLQPEVE